MSPRKSAVAKPKWSEEGQEPDYRFTLANERTFLAWLRTALALLAGAIALNEIVPNFSAPGARTALAVALGSAGTLLAAFSYHRWAGCQRAMRNGRPLPTTRVPFAVGWAITAAGVVVAVILLTETS